MKKIVLMFTCLLLLCGCNTVISENITDDKENLTAYNLSFNESDSDPSYQINGSTLITLGNEDIKITKGGTYILEGILEGASIIVDVDKSEDVQLVLNNVTINADDFAGIYIVEGDEITITLAENSVNTISDTGSYVKIDSNSVDALIYSKADLIINGSGTLNLKSEYNHGIVSKDDLIITGGTFNIDVAGQGLSGKDCLMISNGTFNLTTGKDALKSDNSEDEYRGYVNITGGTFTINTGADAIYGYNLVNIKGGSFDITTAKSSNADSYKGIKSEYSITISGGEFKIDSYDDAIHCDTDIVITGGTFEIESDDDAIHADGLVQIDSGDFTIDAHEGIEGTYILINGGNITINASDDGINAAQKVSTYTATVEINGGYLTIVMGQGDTDGIDSNGYIYINGGTVDITGQFPFDYDKGAEHNGGTIIVNGSETDEISNQFGNMGGFGGMGQKPGNFNNQTPGSDNQLPEGQFDPSEMPSGEFPSGEFPSGEFPSGDFPSGQFPGGGNDGEHHHRN